MINSEENFCGIVSLVHSPCFRPFAKKTDHRRSPLGNSARKQKPGTSSTTGAQGRNFRRGWSAVKIGKDGGTPNARELKAVIVKEVLSSRGEEKSGQKAVAMGPATTSRSKFFWFFVTETRRGGGRERYPPKTLPRIEERSKKREGQYNDSKRRLSAYLWHQGIRELGHHVGVDRESLFGRVCRPF